MTQDEEETPSPTLVPERLDALTRCRRKYEMQLLEPVGPGKFPHAEIALSRIPLGTRVLVLEGSPAFARLAEVLGDRAEILTVDGIRGHEAEALTVDELSELDKILTSESASRKVLPPLELLSEPIPRARRLNQPWRRKQRHR